MSGRFWTVLALASCVVLAAQIAVTGTLIYALYQVGAWLVRMAGIA